MKAMRRPLFWYTLVMWILSGIISAFLIQLGALIMSDLPTAGKRISQADFVDQARLTAVEAEIETLESRLARVDDAIEDAEFVLQSRRLDYETQRTNFENWVKTRNATGSSVQDEEVTERVRAIEGLKLAERSAEELVQGLRQETVTLNRSLETQRRELREVREAARAPYQRAQQVEVLKVFGLRLAMTLPLLLIAGWLVLRKRQSGYWPVYRGFVIFALFAFFVELVPYLPSYGGYVRILVGILIALIVARFLILWMARYQRNKKEEEQRPEVEKRRSIDYETAVKKISAGQCPSCDRQFGAKPARGEKAPPPQVDFCVHCGFCLFSKCGNCGARENSFYKFCGACGAARGEPELPAKG